MSFSKNKTKIILYQFGKLMGDTLPSKHLFQKQTLGIPKIFLFKILQTLKLKKPNFHWLEQLSGNNLCKNYSCKVVSYQPNLTMIKDFPNFDTLLDCYF